MTHFYGHFEALLKDYVVQPWPVDQVNDDEQMRFGQVARLWDKIHPPGSPEWKAYLEEHRKLGTTFDPTMTAYAAGRDLMRMRNADWHSPLHAAVADGLLHAEPGNHGSYWYYWTLEDEIAWRNFYQVWFRLLNDYKKMGGARHRQRRRRLHLQHLRLRQHPRVRAAAGGRLPPARGDPVRHLQPREDARRRAGGKPIDRGLVRAGSARRPGHRRSEPAEEPEGALRHRRAAPERPDREAGMDRRHQVHRSRTASSTTRRSCWRTWRRWSRNRSSQGRRRRLNGNGS